MVVSAHLLMASCLPPTIAPQAPPRPWMAAWLNASERQLPASSLQGISNMMWALARLGVHPGQGWLARMLSSSAGRIGTCREQALSNCCWALARLDQLHTQSQQPLLHGAGGGYSDDDDGGQRLQASLGAGHAGDEAGTAAAGSDGGELRALLQRTGWLRSMLLVSQVRWAVAVFVMLLASAALALRCDLSAVGGQAPSTAAGSCA